MVGVYVCFFFQAEDGIRYLVRSRGLGDVYKRQEEISASIEEMSAMTRQNADNSHTATSLMEETSKSVRDVENNAKKMSDTMHSIQDASAPVSYTHLTLPTSDLV